MTGLFDNDEFLQFTESAVLERLESFRAETAADFFPAYKDRIYFFGFDEEGRCIALFPPELSYSNTTLIQAIFTAQKVICIISMEVVPIALNVKAEINVNGVYGLAGTYITRDFWQEIDYRIKQGEGDHLELQRIKIGDRSTKTHWIFERAHISLMPKIQSKARGKSAYLRLEVQMRQHQIERMLKDEGFSYSRESKNGEIWTDGTSNILVGRQYRDVRAIRNLKADIRRAVEIRANPPAPKPVIPVTPPIAPMFRAVPEPKLVLQKPIELSKATSQDLPEITEPPRIRKKQKARYGRYFKGVRYVVWKRIKELHLMGYQPSAIEFKMNSEGFKLADGVSPMEVEYISPAISGMYKAGIITEREYHEHVIERKPLPSVITLGGEYKDLDIISQAPSKPAPNFAPAPIATLPPAAPAAPAAPQAVVMKEQAKPVPSARIPDAIMAILKSKDFSDQAKANMLLMWSEENVGRLPDAVINILTDPQISNHLKVRMTEALLAEK